MLALRYLLLKYSHTEAIELFDALYPDFDIDEEDNKHLHMPLQEFEELFHHQYPNVNVTYLSAIGMMNTFYYRYPLLGKYLTSLTNDQFFKEFTEIVKAEKHKHRIQYILSLSLANKVINDHKLLPYVMMLDLKARSSVAYQISKVDPDYAIEVLPNELRYNIGVNTLLDVLNIKKKLHRNYLINNDILPLDSMVINYLIEGIAQSDEYDSKIVGFLTPQFKHFRDKFNCEELISFINDINYTILYLSILREICDEKTIKQGLKKYANTRTLNKLIEDI